MPKVLRVIARLNVGGPARHVILLTHRLRPEYETVLVSGIEAPAEGNMLYLAQELGVPVVRIPQLGREISPHQDLLALLRLCRLIRKERPQIVHTHTAKAGMLGRLAARLCGVPVVVHTFHGNVFQGYFGPRKTQFFLNTERLLARMSDRILTVTDQQRTELLRYGITTPEKLLAFGQGFDLAELAKNEASPAAMRRKWGLPLETPVVGIVGRLVPIKAHELFLEAAALVQQSYPEARFAIIGPGERRTALEHYSRELGVQAVFTGFEGDLPAVFASLDIVCLSSLNEGSPGAVIEALAAGKPVVSTAVGGVVDLVRNGETGFLVHDRNPRAFADAILRLLRHPEMAVAMGAKGRAAVYPRYDISRLSEDMRGLYGELLSAA